MGGFALTRSLFKHKYMRVLEKTPLTDIKDLDMKLKAESEDGNGPIYVKLNGKIWCDKPISFQNDQFALIDIQTIRKTALNREEEKTGKRDHGELGLRSLSSSTVVRLDKSLLENLPTEELIPKHEHVTQTGHFWLSLICDIFPLTHGFGIPYKTQEITRVLNLEQSAFALAKAYRSEDKTIRLMADPAFAFLAAPTILSTLSITEKKAELYRDRRYLGLVGGFMTSLGAGILTNAYRNYRTL